MLRRVRVLALLALLLAGPAAAEEHPIFYVGASAGGHLVLTDIDLGELSLISRPIPIESSLYAELRLGLDLSEAWAIELSFGYLPFDASIETNDGLDIAARARWTFADVAVRPYLLAGGGVYINPQPDPDGTPTVFAPELHYGLGLGPRVLDTLRLRFEVRHQLTDGIGDDIGMAVVALAGLDLLPGAGSDAPAPADRDGDGVPDDDDACPDQPARTPDGCPAPEAPADRDGDGVTDDRDACPDQPARTPDGCPAAPADRDDDGVPDDRDACPDEAAPTADGCPPRPAAPKVELTCEALEVDEIVLFDTGSYQLRADARHLLDEVARTLTEHPELRRVRILGFTDATGSASYNERLSLQRAWVVREALVERGVAKGRLAVIGRGERAPAAGANADDRRVEFTITGAGARADCPSK
ncbi:MAG: OmpA family protein [Myxococcales bacterium]|nr:OmpA family protein [Myxococcales bacterium]